LSAFNQIFSLSSQEFLQKVYPYKKLLKQQLYKDLLNSYMNPNIEPIDNNISLPRNIMELLKIINLNIVSII
jgi:hypothetical protein